MLAIGFKISNMALEKKNGVMVASFRDSMNIHIKKDRVNIVGQVGTDILVNGMITPLMGKDYFFGQMEEFT